jgi:hypothetical protein
MLACPHCGSVRLFGPATIIGTDGAEHTYYDCGACHSMLLVTDAGLVAKAGAW